MTIMMIITNKTFYWTDLVDELTQLTANCNIFHQHLLQKYGEFL